MNESKELMTWIERHKYVKPSLELSKDYSCEDGRFPVPASCVTISNPDSPSSSETGVNTGTRS